MQQVIVYRNPLEAAFWDAMMHGGFIAIIAGMGAFFLVFFTVNRLLNGDHWQAPAWKLQTSLALSFVAFAAVIWHML